MPAHFHTVTVVVAAASLAILSVRRAEATAVVTFYNNEASFLAAISPPTVIDFEGLTTDTGILNFGLTYHTGNVTFSSDPSESVLVVGPHAPALGAPFDSALLIPEGEPSPMTATFDPGVHITAVGGIFSILGGSPQPGTFTLVGSSGQLDRRTVSLGSATAGHPHTFYGFTVTGDTISSLTLDLVPGAQGFDDFTYGTVPAPATASLLLVGALGAIKRRR